MSLIGVEVLCIVRVVLFFVVYCFPRSARAQFSLHEIASFKVLKVAEEVLAFGSSCRGRVFRGFVPIEVGLGLHSAQILSSQLCNPMDA